MDSNTTLEVNQSKESTNDSGFNDADENDNKTEKFESGAPKNSKEVASGKISDPPPPGMGEGKTERLEVPSEELQCIQKQVMIEKLMKSSSPTKAKVKVVEEGDEIMDVDGEESEFKRRIDNELDGLNDNRKKRFRRPLPPKTSQQNQPHKTFKIRSSVLDRVKSFLPELKTANDSLLRLPDPSKISLESDSDRDEMDGASLPGPSGTTKTAGDCQNDGSKTVVEMNLALFEESGSDTSSDDDDDDLPIPMKVKGLPDISKKKSSTNKTTDKIMELDETGRNGMAVSTTGEIVLEESEGSGSSKKSRPCHSKDKETTIDV